MRVESEKLGFREILKILLILGILVQTFSCATVVAPPGGPEDKLPPRVSGTTLAPNSVNQSTNLDLTLQFDKWIVQKPPSGAIAISPPIVGRIRIKADGDKLRIYSDAPLDSNTTYTLTVTNAIRDLRSNPLENSFQILFSTGSFLDSLKTDFSVFLHDSLINKKKFPVVAFYPIGNIRAQKGYLEKYRDSTLTAEADTIPNITKEIPLYIAQTDSLGNGTLQGMKAGKYLAASFLDENNNQRMDVESEVSGIAAYPFELSEEKRLLRFSLGDLDTSSLTLDNVSQRGNKEVEFSFSRNIVLDSIFRQKGNCYLATARDTIFSSGFYTDRNSKNTVLIAENLKNDTLYTAACLYAIDSLGRNLDTARSSAKFRFKQIPEKEITPTILSKTEPAARGVTDFLPGQPIKLYYNRSISPDTINFRLYINEDSVAVAIKQVDAAHLEISSEPPIKSDSRIKLVQVVKDTIVDTLFTEKIITQFSTISRLKLASLKGNIPGGNAQTIIVLREIPSSARTPASTASSTASSTADRKANRTARASSRRSSSNIGREWTVTCDSSGNFEIKGLPEGIYSIMYFKDMNGDGRLTSGSVYPLATGEPWAAPEEDLILPHGDDNILKELLKDLPEL